MDNIALIGFSYTGKSHVARELAALLGWASVDTDAEVVHRAGMPIDRIFDTQGEAVFRQLECEALASACAGQQRVIATGGGACMDLSNRRILEEYAFVVCLEAGPETILRRLQEGARSGDAEERPLLRAVQKAPDLPAALAIIREWKAQRQATYALAYWTIHTDVLSVVEVAQEIARACAARPL